MNYDILTLEEESTLETIIDVSSFDAFTTINELSSFLYISQFAPPHFKKSVCEVSNSFSYFLQLQMGIPVYLIHCIILTLQDVQMHIKG